MNARHPSAAPPSPCVRNCCLDDDNVCIGCGRALAEIIAWSGASDEERRAILARCAERQAARRRRYGSP